MRLVECVPNFSEGRDKAAIKAITDAIESMEGVSLLDVDPGADTNRTVVTFVGSPESVVEGAFRGIKAASEVIDMSRHKGAHPRIGATDVCPFVPVAGVTMEECAALARQLGGRVGKELGIPVYLYEFAASRPGRANLADIRSGEYEGLEAKLKDPEWTPDFGPAAFNARSGATVIGARRFLVAYNVNLNTRSRKLAQEIAFSIREAGRAKRDGKGEILRHPDGTSIKIPGTLKAVKAVGWYIEEYRRAQISINLVDCEVTPPHAAFEECCKVAETLGLRVTGSELIGLIPLNLMLEAGRYYLGRQGRSMGVSEAELVEAAVQSLGLAELAPFDPRQKILEYRVAGEAGALVKKTVEGFVRATASEDPTPGGGSVAALCGSLSAALAAMVANLTHGTQGYEAHREAMERGAITCQEAIAFLLAAVDRDTAAFDGVMTAFRLPKGTPEETAERQAAIETTTKEATLVPFEVLERTHRLLPFLAELAEKGNSNALSDVGVAALTACTAAEGAWMNVRINLKTLKDTAFVADFGGRADDFLREVVTATDAVRTRIREALQ